MAESLPDDLKECESIETWMKCHELDSPGVGVLRNTFTKLIKYFFSSKENLSKFDSDLECRLDGMHIVPGAVIDPGNTNNVPGIVITTGEGVNMDRPWLIAQVDKEPDFATQENVHWATVNMTFVCLDFDADICAKIADAVMFALVSIEPMLLETWRWLKQYKPKQQTSPQLARKATDQNAFEDFYESRVIVELQYVYATLTRRESRRMQDYAFTGDVVGINSVDDVVKTR